MFTLKKTIGVLLGPLPLLLALLLAGLLACWFSRRGDRGRALLSVGVALLLLLSNGQVADAILRPLERRHPVYTVQPGFVPAHVVVLAGGHFANPALPVVSRLGPDTLARLAEGIRIQRLHPESRLILSGGAVFGASSSSAAAMADVAVALGVARTRILLEDHSRDTHDEAERIRKMVGDAPLVLVTSAVHMPRSMALFRKVGLRPRPAPVAHRVTHDGIGNPNPTAWVPRPDRLADISAAVHEYLGLLWSTLRRQI